MLITTTIRLDDQVKKAARKKILLEGIRGGLSGYIESLILKDLKKVSIKEA